MLVDRIFHAFLRSSVGSNNWRWNLACCAIFQTESRRFKSYIPCGRPVISTTRLQTQNGGRPLSQFQETSTARFLHSVQRPVTCVIRSVLFEDTQMYKVVHGGVYLELSEEAGDILVQRYCSDSNLPQDVVPALSQMERVQFVSSAALGDILSAEGEVIFTTPHSIRVFVSVYASPVIGSENRKLITRSWLWYVLVNSKDFKKLLPVPPLSVKDPKQEEEGRLQHEKNVADRQRRQSAKVVPTSNFDPTISVRSSHIIKRSHCGWKSFCRAGPVLKWIDELGGLVSGHHAQYRCVTGSCDSVNFYSKIMPGSVVTITASPVFTSNRTVDLQCFADVETSADGHVIKERAVEAFFTFVTRQTTEKPPPVPQFMPKTDEEKATYERRMKVYQERKQNSKTTVSS